MSRKAIFSRVPTGQRFSVTGIHYRAITPIKVRDSSGRAFRFNAVCLSYFAQLATFAPNASVRLEDEP